MIHKQQILDYYSTGRYECDYDFYIYLQKLVKELNLYQWEQKIIHQGQLVKKITDLTLQNSNNSNQDYEDDEVISQTYKIKSLLAGISTKHVHSIISECQALNWQSYNKKAERTIIGKPIYQKILNRINTHVHSEQFRSGSILFTSLFEMINGEAVDKHIELYTITIQSVLQYLNSMKSVVDTINQFSKYSNICNTSRVKIFIGILNQLLKTSLRFCEIIKILVGKNNLSLKFTVIKKEIQKIIKQNPQWNYSIQKQEIFYILPAFKQFLKGQKHLDKNRICRWCFSQLKKQIKQHQFCREIIENKGVIKKY